MSLIRLLEQEMENNYDVTYKLFRLVEPGQLCWKPPTGSNWMTVAQLMMHCAAACGGGIRGFVTGDWGLPEGVDLKDLTPEQMLPPATALPGVKSVDEALALLAEDRRMAAAALHSLSETDLLGSRFPAPWGGPEFTLFQHLLHMVAHLAQHKGQMFYYLKLLGKNLKTPDLWGDV